RVHCVAIESVTENRADLQPAVGHHRRYCLGAGYFFDAITQSFGEGTERAAIDYAVGIAARRIGNAGAGKNTDGQVDCIVDAAGVESADAHHRTAGEVVVARPHHFQAAKAWLGRARQRSMEVSLDAPA